MTGQCVTSGKRDRAETQSGRKDMGVDFKMEGQGDRVTGCGV